MSSARSFSCRPEFCSAFLWRPPSYFPAPASRNFWISLACAAGRFARTRICIRIVCHWPAVNSPGLRTIWQRPQLSVHNSAPDRGSVFTWVIFSTLVFSGGGAGVWASDGKAKITIAAPMVTAAKRWMDLIGPRRRALVSLQIGIERSLVKIHRRFGRGVNRLARDWGRDCS
jgi:hypothetical protein